MSRPANRPFLSRRGWLAGGTAMCLLLSALAGKAVWDYSDLGDSPLPVDITTSKVVLDRDGRLLRAFTTPDDKWRLPIEPDEIDPLYWAMLMAYEDQRFERHRGVDAVALARAVYQLMTSGRIVSGGSTLTMQVARLLEEHSTRSPSAKYAQLLGAWKLEADLAKKDILQLYALRAPFGGNLEGIRAASLTWFGKEPKRLTPAQAALLVALPQSPEGRRPDRHAEAARMARDRVLDRAVQAGVLSGDEAKAAKRESVASARRQMPFLAAHAARRAVLEAPERSIHELTLDLELQEALEELVESRVQGFGPRLSAALIVADHETGEVLASVGAPDLLDQARLGHIDMTLATRSPGSTLKPLIYGLAFEEGIAHPESLIDDRPIDIGGYKPTNFDLAYQGQVSVREALQLSLNTPAIQLLEAVGPARLLARIKRSGAQPVIGGKEAPGLAVGLGGLGLSLRELTGLYASLAHEGQVVPLFIDRRQRPNRRPLRILDRTAAWHVGDILTGLPQPQSAADSHIAYKTGTAYGYRDAWAVGYDGRHVIGVWVGRVDGTPVPGMTGSERAVPILFEAFQRLKPAPTPLPPAPAGTLKMTMAELPLPLRAARVLNSVNGGQSVLRIAYPPDRGTIDLGLSDKGIPQPLVVKLRGGTRPFRWFVNGKPAGDAEFKAQISLIPDGPGATRITVLDAVGGADSIDLFLR
ncbi:penicillin-binding protein 1C [Roseibium sp.]|uniref:penicillin-binding protein 1C n=1 Tax=Roseibium sp. TaxID=1936156 RepID=UPI003A973D97